MKYRKRPIVIEAFRYGFDLQPDWFRHHVDELNIVIRNNSCLIHTPEGTMQGEVGDWIIQGIMGEIYPCKPEIFIVTYEPIK